eukprot:gnl/TRDRNA2_/TRDRNA2_170197_c0_seq4.p1 gnl/TRDRNA2_/TRDRNA2_170197_c0~~gnl/TRDRNA2_/TRDRNA2_170197_c0_seq4.p1  ORF type:complete len:110 (-),score=22.90 gnl/TRDRNA2_/TRDRNA2_170197_c0_seq4:65-394(-)
MVEDKKQVAKVLQVAATTKLRPLERAISAELAQLPAGCLLAVETALRGKARNRQQRALRTGQAIARASDRQAKLATEGGQAMPFRCTVTLRGDSDEVWLVLRLELLLAE